MELLFLPEQIARTGGALRQDQSITERIGESFAEAGRLLDEAWQGAAAELYRSRLQQAAMDAKALGAQLGVLSAQLHTVSGIYETGERTARAAGEGLPVDGIFAG